jgi:hypothetical protein
MFWRRGYTLLGEVGGGWALEFPFGAQKTRELEGGEDEALSPWPCNDKMKWEKYVQRHIESASSYALGQRIDNIQKAKLLSKAKRNLFSIFCWTD